MSAKAKPQHFDVRGEHPDGNWHRMRRSEVVEILTAIAADPAECMATLDVGGFIEIEDSGFWFASEGKGRRTWRGEA